MNDSKQSSHVIYLSLGSNIAPEENLRKAVELLAQKVHVVSISNAWRTPAVGSYGPDFLNAVIMIKTGLSRDGLKQEILQPVESVLGRVRTADKYSPRTIDIDILVFDGIVYENEIWSQVHLAVPLAELTSDITHPETGAKIAEVAHQLAHSYAIDLKENVLKKIIKPDPDPS